MAVTVCIPSIGGSAAFRQAGFPCCSPVPPRSDNESGSEYGSEHDGDMCSPSCRLEPGYSCFRYKASAGIRQNMAYGI
ncbi:hypothetical protein [Massilia psychrophila]|uniref:hypothetical protein n=1 Tax=Massilia psychrophila TaxID=1603353 RepID=UPI00351D34FD